MRRLSKIWLLGDSILKGIQLDEETGRYLIKNDMELPELEREFGVTICNASHFGATVERGERLLGRLLSRKTPGDGVVMDFGGNDCDFRWEEIAADPDGEHHPAVPLEAFTEQYRALIAQTRRQGLTPVLTTLPPLIPQRFFDWWCRELDKTAVLRWLGDLCNIYAHQEQYSHAVERLAREESVELVDVRAAFLNHGHIETLMCADGTHPNSAGQTLIAQAFRDFGHQREAALTAELA